jgi:hypothetical protein
MASSNHSQPSTEASASEVLKVVVLELHQLRTQYKELTSRIRNLRIAVDALRELGESTPSEPAEATGLPQLHPNGSSKDSLGERLPRTRSRSRTFRGNSNPDLQRACRIALMESADAISIIEIHARILRRKSFVFVDRESAIHSILNELYAMLHQGELRRVDSSLGTTWQRLESTRTS